MTKLLWLPCIHHWWGPRFFLPAHISSVERKSALLHILKKENKYFFLNALIRKHDGEEKNKGCHNMAAYVKRCQCDKWKISEYKQWLCFMFQNSSIGTEEHFFSTHFGADYKHPRSICVTSHTSVAFIIAICLSINSKFQLNYK